MTSINSMSARAKDKRKNAAKGERQKGGRQNGLCLGRRKCCERVSFSWQRAGEIERENNKQSAGSFWKQWSVQDMSVLMISLV